MDWLLGVFWEDHWDGMEWAVRPGELGASYTEVLLNAMISCGYISHTAWKCCKNPHRRH